MKSPYFDPTEISTIIFNPKKHILRVWCAEGEVLGNFQMSKGVVWDIFLKGFEPL